MVMVDCPVCLSTYRSKTSDILSGHNSKCIRCSRVASRTHGLSKTKIYDIYRGMSKRCYNPKHSSYHNYGSRGITMCDEWLTDIHAFRRWTLDELDATGHTESDLGNGSKQLSIDRIDPYGNYSPSNCRFTSKTIQSRNTRKISNRNVSGYRGVYSHDNKFRARIMVSGSTINIDIHPTKWLAAQAYDQYVRDNNLEHTQNGFTGATVLGCPSIDTLSHITHTAALDYLVSGLITRILNHKDTTYIEKLLVTDKIDIPKLTKEVQDLVKDHPFTYAVAESCLRDSGTIINLH